MSAPAATVWLPIPPLANHYLRVARNRIYKTAQARSYRAQCEAICRAALPAGPFIGPVRVTFVWYRKRRMGDLDNVAKVLFDALSGLLYADDKQIVEILARRDDSRRDRPGIALTVEEIAP